MAKAKVSYECSNCGITTQIETGRCFNCKEFGTMKKITEIKQKENSTNSSLLSGGAKPKKLKDSKSRKLARFSSGDKEFDRLLGGGVVKDAVTLIGAEPGSGKSTLAIQIANHIANEEGNVLYVSGEENENQVKNRANRVNEEIAENLYFFSETCIENVIEHAKNLKTKFLIIDSIQKMHSKDHSDSSAGGVKQVKACTDRLVKFAKETSKSAVFIVAHYTKSKTIAGPSSLEHAVDVSMEMGKNTVGQIRHISLKKNRYGSTETVALYEMTATGLEPVVDGAFITERDYEVTGCSVGTFMEGTRPILVEIQALVEKTSFGYPQRVSSEINKKTLQTYSMILENLVGLNMSDNDIVVQVSGGFKVKGPDLSLSIIMAIASSLSKKPLPNDAAFLGEVALTGEIRPISFMENRIRDLDRKGYKTVYLSKRTKLNQDMLDDISIKLKRYNTVIEIFRELLGEKKK